MLENLWGFISKEWGWSDLKITLKNNLRDLAVARYDDAKNAHVGGYNLDASKNIIFVGYYNKEKVYVIIIDSYWTTGEDVGPSLYVYVLCENRELLEGRLYKTLGKHVDSDITAVTLSGEINFTPIKIIEKGGKLEFNTI